MSNRELLLCAVLKAIEMRGGVEAFDEMPKPNMGGGMNKVGTGGAAGGGAGDGNGGEATLEEHDKRWHPGGYKGGPCGWREKHGIPTTDPNGGEANKEAQKAAEEATKGTGINPDNVSEIWRPGEKVTVVKQPEGELKKENGGLGDLHSQKSAENVQKLEQLNAQAKTPEQKTLIQGIYERLKDKLSQLTANLGNNGGNGGEGGAVKQQPEAKYEREEDIPDIDKISDEEWDKLSDTQQQQILDKSDKQTAALNKETEKVRQKGEKEREKIRKGMMKRQVGLLREGERKSFRKAYDDEFKSIENRVKSGEITRRQGDRLQKKAEDKYFKAHDDWSAKKDEDYEVEANKRVSELLANAYKPKPVAEGAKPVSKERRVFQNALGNSHKSVAERASNGANAQKHDIFTMSDEEFSKLDADTQKAALQNAWKQIHEKKPEAKEIKPYRPSGWNQSKPPTPMRKKLGDVLQRWGKALSDMGGGSVQHTYRDLALKHRVEMRARGVNINPMEVWTNKDLMADRQNELLEKKHGEKADRILGESHEGEGEAAKKNPPISLHKSKLFGAIKNIDDPEISAMAHDIEKRYRAASTTKEKMSIVAEWKRLAKFADDNSGGGAENDDDDFEMPKHYA